MKANSVTLSSHNAVLLTLHQKQISRWPIKRQMKTFQFNFQNQSDTDAIEVSSPAIEGVDTKLSRELLITEDVIHTTLFDQSCKIIAFGATANRCGVDSNSWIRRVSL